MSRLYLSNVDAKHVPPMPRLLLRLNSIHCYGLKDWGMNSRLKIGLVWQET